jgi:hypothetical protein
MTTAALLFCIANFLSRLAFPAAARKPDEKKKAAAQPHSFSHQRSKRADRYTLPLKSKPAAAAFSFFSGPNKARIFICRTSVESRNRMIPLFYFLLPPSSTLICVKFAFFLQFLIIPFF